MAGSGESSTLLPFTKVGIRLGARGLRRLPARPPPTYEQTSKMNGNSVYIALRTLRSPHHTHYGHHVRLRRRPPQSRGLIHTEILIGTHPPTPPSLSRHSPLTPSSALGPRDIRARVRCKPQTAVNLHAEYMSPTKVAPLASPANLSGLANAETPKACNADGMWPE